MTVGDFCRMAKRTRVRDYDQFIVRLPPGMRDRIKAKADRAGMSMNEAIVWCLEQHFPAPTTIEQKLEELAELVAILKGDDTYHGVDRLISEVHDTIVDVYEKTAKAPPDFRKAVSERFDQWREWEAENAASEAYDPFEDAHYPESGAGSAGALEDHIPFDSTDDKN
jgi:hypothetical protein